MSVKKYRLDHLLLEKNLAAPLEKARALIMTGQVLVQDRPMTKPGTLLPSDTTIRIRVGRTDCPWVSRGGLKLVGALEAWKIDPQDKICLDVGASTGGFSDVLLQNGARRVYALDVGYGLLDWKLVSDPRIVVMDRTNIRHLNPEQIADPIDLLTTDVSFISLSQALPPALATLKPNGEGVALIKPQFELPKDRVGKGGVVREASLHQQAIDDILAQAEAWNIHPLGVCPSPLTGPKGNREFLFHYRKKP